VNEGKPSGDVPPFKPARPDPLLQRAVPVAKVLPGYRARKARSDLVAGITVAALATMRASTSGPSRSRR
jgi:hypothetical protein